MSNLDEVRSLTTPSTAILLSESRKFRVGLTLRHQFTRHFNAATYLAGINYAAYARLLIGGEPGRPYSVRTLPGDWQPRAE